MTIKKFLERAKSIHGRKYDYSLVDYKNIDEKIQIICPIHKIFEQKPIYHLRGHGCKKCALKEMTTEEFIEKAKSVHGNKYDYSFVNYKKCNSSINIICNIHGIFKQKPSAHLCGYGCQKCGGVYRPTTEEFIEKAKSVHGNKYDYSFVNYISALKFVNIICPIHGEFKQTPNSHISNKHGCPICGGKENIDTKKFIEKAKLVHGNKYDYSFVNYVSSSKKIKIICHIHGEFEQTANSHLSGHCCPKCSDKHKPTTEEFIEKAKLVHGNKYDYSFVNYKTNNDKVRILCLEHGEFEQSPDAHLNQKQGCPFCKESKGERVIKKYLEENKILFERQAEFDKCVNPKTNKKLKFDFYLPKQNLCIEFDGLQHFKPVKRFGGEQGYISCVYRDNIKNEFCEKNNIRLFRIKYSDKIINKLKNI